MASSSTTPTDLSSLGGPRPTDANPPAASPATSSISSTGALPPVSTRQPGTGPTVTDGSPFSFFPGSGPPRPTNGGPRGGGGGRNGPGPGSGFPGDNRGPNNGLSGSQNYFFGFLITFLILLVVFLGCGCVSRRRFLARRRRVLRHLDHFGLNDPHAGGGEARGAKLPEPKWVNLCLPPTGREAKSDWGLIKPLSAAVMLPRTPQSPITPKAAVTATASHDSPRTSSRLSTSSRASAFSVSGRDSGHSHGRFSLTHLSLSRFLSRNSSNAHGRIVAPVAPDQEQGTIITSANVGGGGIGTEKVLELPAVGAVAGVRQVRVAVMVAMPFDKAAAAALGGEKMIGYEFGIADVTCVAPGSPDSNSS